MANVLSKSNIANSNIIEAWQVSQSVDAFTGITAYDITISGSLTVTGSTNLSGSVNITGGDLTTRGFSNATASWATNVVNNPTTVDGDYLPQGTPSATTIPLKFAAGAAEIGTGLTQVTVTFPTIQNKILGTDVFVTVGVSSSYATSSMAYFPRVASLTNSGDLTFSMQVANASNPTPFFFTIMYKP
jgi:hypothetical protein